MPKAPYNRVIQFGTKALGVGPFIQVASESGRIVPLSRVVEPANPLLKVSVYITWTTFAASAGAVTNPFAQGWLKDYRSAHRIRNAAFPAVVFCILAIQRITPFAGGAYWRAQCCIDPP